MVNFDIFPSQDKSDHHKIQKTMLFITVGQNAVLQSRIEFVQGTAFVVLGFPAVSSHDLPQVKNHKICRKDQSLQIKNSAVLPGQRNYSLGQILYCVVFLSCIELIDWFLLTLFLWLHRGYCDLHQLRIWLLVLNLHSKFQKVFWNGICGVVNESWCFTLDPFPIASYVALNIMGQVLISQIPIDPNRSFVWEMIAGYILLFPEKVSVLIKVDEAVFFIAVKQLGWMQWWNLTTIIESWQACLGAAHCSWPWVLVLALWDGWNSDLLDEILVTGRVSSSSHRKMYASHANLG